jgi:hypothetical protein
VWPFENAESPNKYWPTAKEKDWIHEKVRGLPDAVVMGCTRESSKVVTDSLFVIIFHINQLVAEGFLIFSLIHFPLYFGI